MQDAASIGPPSAFWNLVRAQELFFVYVPGHEQGGGVIVNMQEIFPGWGISLSGAGNTNLPSPTPLAPFYYMPAKGEVTSSVLNNV